MAAGYRWRRARRPHSPWCSAVTGWRIGRGIGAGIRRHRRRRRRRGVGAGGSSGVIAARRLRVIELLDIRAEYAALHAAVFHWRQRIRGRIGLKRYHPWVLVEEALLLADVVVLGVGLDRGLGIVAQDVRLQKDQKVGLGLLGIAGPKQLTEDRNGAQPRHRLLAVGHAVLYQAAQYQGAAVLDQHAGGDGALVGDQVNRALGGRRETGTLDLKLQQHRVAFADGRRHRQNGADLLALNGLEGAAGAIGGGVLAGQER